MKIAYVYILKCPDKTYYTGVTTNLFERLNEHKDGKYQESYTYKRRPVDLVFYCEFTDITIAIGFEKKIKKWSKRKKEALINGEYSELINLAKKT